MAAEHGGPVRAELAALGIDPEGLLDLSVSTNPYGPSRAMVQAVRRARIDRYPDTSAEMARSAIAQATGARPEEVLLGAGAADLLWSIGRQFGAGATTLLLEPAFSELGEAIRSCGGRLLRLRAKEQDGFAIDWDRVGATARGNEIDLVYLCNPSNPVGGAVDLERVRRFASAHPSACIALDESFLSLSDRFSDAETRLPRNVVRVRSLTKDHAIPGLRVGYLLGPASLVRRLERARPAWATSTLTQAAAVAACADFDFVTRSRLRLQRDRMRLEDGLHMLAIPTLPSVAPYLVARVGDAALLRRRLLGEHAILVRDCSSFGMPGYVRIAARPKAQCERLLAALARA